MTGDLLRKLTLFWFILHLINPAQAVTRLLSEGELLLLSDEKGKQYGSVKIRKFDPTQGALVYEWYLPPEGHYDLASPLVRKGTAETHQVKGRAIVAFGPFVLEWHGSGAGKGAFSANGLLGVHPLLIATSAIHEVTRIRDTRAGFSYEPASTLEIPDPLGLATSFKNLPKARLGIGVADTFIENANGTQQPVVVIAKVDSESEAFEKGLRVGQYLLTLDGTPVSRASDFHALLREVKPGDQVILQVRQGDQQLEFVITAQVRLTSPLLQPTPTPDPNLSLEERQWLETNLEVQRLMEQTIEALRGVVYE